MASIDDESVVYLSSLASKNKYPDNVPGSFTNDIVPLSLDPNREYETALHGIYIPKRTYTLHRDDSEAIVEVIAEFFEKKKEKKKKVVAKASEDGEDIIDDDDDDDDGAITGIRKQLRYHLRPPRNITSKNVGDIVEELNASWIKAFRGIFGVSTSISNNIQNYSKYFTEELGIISYSQNYVNYHKRSRDGCDGVNYCKISLLFKPRMAAILGFIPNYKYDIFVTDENEHYALKQIRGDFVPDPHADIDYLHLYCDAIQSTRFAGQMANILATLPYGESNNYYSVQKPIYKKLSKNAIDAISILVTDQYGRKVYFEQHRSATIVLHIRPSPAIF